MSALFLGSKPLGLTIVREMAEALGGALEVATVDDRQDVRGCLPAYEAWAAANGKRVHLVDNNRNLKEWIRQHRPSFVFVCGWYRLLPKPVLELVPGGFYGLHASLLPLLRGNAPLVWTLLNGHSHAGVTLFQFDEGMDTGPVVDRISFEVGSGDDIRSLLERTGEACMTLVRNNVRSIASGTAVLTPQDHAQATYASARRPEDGRIDWSRPASFLIRFIKAQTRPYPGAFTVLPDGRVVRVWKASLFPRPYSGIPGLVEMAEGEGRIVCCGEGAIIVEDIEIDGHTIAPAGALKFGTRFA